MKHYIRSRQRGIKNMVHDPKIIDELWGEVTSKWAKRAKNIDVVSASLLSTVKKPA